MAAESTLVIRGTFIHAPEYGKLEVLEDKVLAVRVGDETSSILAIVDGATEEQLLQSHGLSNESVIRLGEQEFMIPGFIDTHIHAPQYMFAGTGTDLPLMQWLQKYTFPTEASFADPATANLNYQLVVRRLLSLGTTTATYYGTIHTQQCKLLADIVKTLGQRAVVGKVNMDRNSPADYVEDAAAGVSGAEEFVTYCQALGCPRVMPCVTPRFIPTCSLESMRSLADVAARHGVHLQTHISESADEVAFSKSLHPEFANDTEVYKSVGVLGPKSVLAHATFMGDDEYRALAAAGCGIAHCPLSNFFVSDWKLRVNHVKKLGVKVGLGTDVAGGYSPSILVAMRMAVITGNALYQHKHIKSLEGTFSGEVAEDVLDFRRAFHLATLGGAQVLDLASKLGTFEVGKEFDALRIHTAVPNCPFDVFAGRDGLMDRFEKFINLGDDRNITHVYVAGRLVKHGATFPRALEKLGLYQ